MNICIAFAAVIVSYLAGSVNFAVIFTKAFTKKDVRDYGSGNAGSTNAMRVGGKASGTLTFIFDFLKGTFSSFVGLKAFEYIAQHSDSSFAVPVYGACLCGIFCMIGHVFPVFFGFRGGKAVATGAGIFVPFCPLATVIGLISFALITVISGYVSIGSLSATAIVVVCGIVLDGSGGNRVIIAVMEIIIGLIIFIKHSDNIKRIIEHKEHSVYKKRNERNGT